MKCEFCNKEAIAKINIPGPAAQWACVDHFNEWQYKRRAAAQERTPGNGSMNTPLDQGNPPATSE
jgi:hypothetical protein